MAVAAVERRDEARLVVAMAMARAAATEGLLLEAALHSCPASPGKILFLVTVSFRHGMMKKESKGLLYVTTWYLRSALVIISLVADL